MQTDGLNKVGDKVETAPMTTMTMKSSEAIPSSFVRPKLNERHLNTIQPLWMRVLEEKYQKLQLRIAQSTATMNGIYNSAIGRSIYDSKLVRASLQRTKDPTQPAKRRNGNYEIKAKISATQITSNPGLSKSNIPSTSIDNGVCKSDIRSHADKERHLFERINTDDESVNKFDKEIKVKERGTKVSEILYLRYDKTQTHKKNISELIAKRKNKITYGEIDNAGKNSNVQTTDTSSRYSYSTQKTIQSCPNRINESVTSVHKNNMLRAQSDGKTKVNRRKMKMFSRMSAEAQTALTETIMENRSEDNIESDFEDAEQVIEDSDNVFVNDCGISLEEIDSNKNRDNCNDSVESMASRDSRSIHTRLPELTKENGDFHTLNNVRQVDCRVPGIGTRKFPYSSKREVTFEITPPGFDIRYKDAPIREERESETPPPEIKDRAIRKCQDWLSRYTSRTPRQSQTSN